jgi:hypothetical protein
VLRLRDQGLGGLQHATVWQEEHCWTSPTRPFPGHQQWHPAVIWNYAVTTQNPPECASGGLRTHVPSYCALGAANCPQKPGA